MTRTGQAAIDYARSRVGPNAMPASGYCLQFVRQCFDVPSYYASAVDAWNASPTQHPGDRNPPTAVPLFFLSPSIYEHVVFGGATGEIITTFNADVRQYWGANGPDVIAQIERDFSGSYLGWTEDINRVTVWTPGSNPSPDDGDGIVSEGDAMIRISAPNRGIAVVGAGYYKSLTEEEFQNSEPLVEKTVEGNDRQFDLWVSIATQGIGAPMAQAQANQLANVAGWVYAGGPDVNAGAADPGSIGARTIHVDQRVAGAQGTTPNVASQVDAIHEAVAGE